MTPYKYYLAGSPTFFDSSGNQFLSEFQNQINERFDSSPDIYTVKEETSIGSNIYNDIVVRVTRAIDSTTGKFLGDDFKKILFKDVNHIAGIGRKYYFDNNYWITTFSEIYKNFSSSIMIRRCNNRLKWIDSEGIIYSEPCIIDYQIPLSGDSIGNKDSLVLPKSVLRVFTQLNSRTNKIRSNQRFLFGTSTNRYAFKIVGDGIENYLNQKTNDDESSYLLEFYMMGNYVNTDVDNIDLGIADYYENISSASFVENIIITPNEFNITEGNTKEYLVQYLAGSTVTSTSFVFSINDNLVPSDHYVFNTISGSKFSISNIERYLESSLNILADAVSGSRLIEINLRGEW